MDSWQILRLLEKSVKVAEKMVSEAFRSHLQNPSPKSVKLLKTAKETLARAKEAYIKEVETGTAYWEGY